MSQLVTIFGGTGFVGRYIARRMARAGWRVRVVTRDPANAMFLRGYGVVGQVEPVFGNIRDEATTRAAIHGADAVINCTGILSESGANSFKAIHVTAAERIARIASAEGVGHLVHLSAIGAEGESQYGRTKAAGEAAVLAHFPRAVILRPSLIFGTEDKFFNRFAAMPGPVLPIAGGQTLIQPVYVDDVAAAAEAAIAQNASGIFELGGPEAKPMRALMDDMLAETRRRKLVINMPFGLAKITAFASVLANKLSLGILPAMATPDQITLLTRDNVVGSGMRGLQDLGITPTDMGAVLPGYLWRFRPSGQFLAIKESARNIRD